MTRRGRGRRLVLEDEYWKLILDRRHPVEHQLPVLVLQHQPLVRRAVESSPHPFKEECCEEA